MGLCSVYVLFISLLHVGYVSICFGVTQYGALFQHSYERVKQKQSAELTVTSFIGLKAVM
jgi:hypothetical protein